MRKLKKSLAVILVLVMALTMVPFASASVTTVASFNDAADVSPANLMALDVLAAVNVLRGEDGSIYPQRTINRAEAAAIVARTLIGPAAADALPPARTGFRDVDGVSGIDAWASGPIGFLHERGIVIGIGDDLFDPLAPVTGAELAVMFLRAVGFGVNGEYTGPRWQTNAVVDGMHWRILTGDADFTAPATREQVFRYAFNAMNTNELATQLQFVNWSTDRQAYIPVALQGGTLQQRLDTIYGRIFNPAPINLVRTHGLTDDFGRPITRFTLRGQEVGQYATTAAVYFTERTSEANVNAAINAFVLPDHTPAFVNGSESWGFGDPVSVVEFHTATVNGLARNTLARDIHRLTGNGVLVEVFVNEATSEVTTVTAIRTDIAVVQRTSSTEVRVAPVTADNVDGTRNARFASSSSLDVGPLNDTFAYLRELAVADYVLITPVWRNGEWQVGNAAVPETATGALRAAANFTNFWTTGSLTVGDNVYRRAAVLSAGARNATVQNVGEQVIILLDDYGFVVHAHGTTASRQDVMIVRATPNTLVNGVIAPNVRGYFADGTAVDRVLDAAYIGPVPAIVHVSTGVNNRIATVATQTSVAPPATSSNSSLVINLMGLPATVSSIAANQAALNIGGQIVRFADDARYFFWNDTARNFTITERGNTLNLANATSVLAILEYRGTTYVAPVISAIVMVGVRQQGEINLETLRFLREGSVGASIVDGAMLHDARLIDVFGTTTTVPVAVNTDIAASRWVAATEGQNGVFSVIDVADQVGTNLSVFTRATVNGLVPAAGAAGGTFAITSETDPAETTFAVFNVSTSFIDISARPGSEAINSIDRFNDLWQTTDTRFSVAINASGVATVIIAH